MPNPKLRALTLTLTKATTPIDPAMLPAIRSSLLNGTRKDGSDADLRFDLPTNFQGGIADPYFAGKLLPIPPHTSLYLPISPYRSPSPSCRPSPSAAAGRPSL